MQCRTATPALPCIPLPEFVTRAEFDWAVQEATAKKKKDFSKVEFFTYDEGLCVQCMHIGPYDTEPETLRQLDAFAAEQGYCPDRMPQHGFQLLRCSAARVAQIDLVMEARV